MNEKQGDLKMNSFKKGDRVARVMKRYNPQIGMYYVVSEVEIKSATKTGYSIENYRTRERYDLNGKRKGKVECAYGSAEYFLTDFESAKHYQK